VVAGGFISWLWVLSVYPTATVASFSYLTPVFAIALGHVFFDEPITLALGVAALLVGIGITLINRRV
jgi:drug/metabolite transporter (DMT)-like permease